MKTTDSSTLVFERSWLGLIIPVILIAFLLYVYIWVLNDQYSSFVLLLNILVLGGVVVSDYVFGNLPGSYLKLSQEGIEYVERKLLKTNVVHYKWSTFKEVSLGANRLTLYNRLNRQSVEIKLSDFYDLSFKVNGQRKCFMTPKRRARFFKQICQENHVVFTFYQPYVIGEVKL